MLPVVATPKRNDITIEQKKELKQYCEENNTFTHSMIAAHFSNQWNMRLVRSTVSGILRSELADGRSPVAKRKKYVEYPHLEESLYLYFFNKFFLYFGKKFFEFDNSSNSIIHPKPTGTEKDE